MKAVRKVVRRMSVGTDTKAGQKDPLDEYNEKTTAPRKKTVVHRVMRRLSLQSSSNRICGEEASVDSLIKWDVDILLDLLKKIAKSRASPASAADTVKVDELEAATIESKDRPFLGEQTDFINMGRLDTGRLPFFTGSEVDIGANVVDQLLDFVKSIAHMYPNHSFHNFEHASHVAMSLAKLFTRFFPPYDGDGAKDPTFGIKSDPLIQFTCVFAALVHDVDHTGAPNAQLAKEKTTVAKKYSFRSIAEQHSLAVAWNLLMQDRFIDLRRTIYQTEAEFTQFRELLINLVLATDISDSEQTRQRKVRWDELFGPDAKPEASSSPEDISRNAALVLELLMQAADTIHTMQEWESYKKWNAKFFLECSRAHQMGRAGKNPIENWYEGEFGFFDFHIIPLASKLKECGVFGEFGNEYLYFAKSNRVTWEQHGKRVVENLQKAWSEQNQLCFSKNVGTLVLSEESVYVPAKAA